MARTIAFLFLLIPTVARADDLFSVTPDKSSVTYTLVHKLHTVHGVATKNIDAKAKLGPSGAQLAIRIPVASFDSGNGNRDEHMQEETEAAKFPSVELKAVVPGAKVQTSGTSTVTLKGKLTFHGVTQDVSEIPLTLTWANAKDVTVKGNFAISLEGYKVERPSLLGVKVDDKIDLEVDLHMVE